MSKEARRTAITPRRDQNYPEWYQQVIKAADLAEISAVRGCMVIKPWGYALWENVQQQLGKMIKSAGYKNAYFPLFIPLKFFEKEAEHVGGFAKECAVVTHSRLQADGKGNLVPVSALEEPIIVRPTSEVIIGESFSKWVQSYRDLPLKINQWANVVRWEMRTRMFLRTSEFLWHEGHAVHASAEEAREEAVRDLEIYRMFIEENMGIPVISGRKSANEKFPGAEETYCVEAMMQDKKALQAGTSHFLGQNFARSSGIKFINQQGEEEYGWTTSWGVSTRLIGGLIMTHSDDDGLVLPPRMAPVHIAILPIFNEENKPEVLDYCEFIRTTLSEQRYHGLDLNVELDLRDIRGGEKFWSWIKKGVPIVIEVGMRDIKENKVCLTRRDNLEKSKTPLNRDEFVKNATDILDDIQSVLFERARKYREENTFDIASKHEFYEFFNSNESGFVRTHWSGDSAIEQTIKQELGVTLRCLPLSYQEAGKCPFSGEFSKQQVIWARSY